MTESQDVLAEALTTEELEALDAALTVVIVARRDEVMSAFFDREARPAAFVAALRALDPPLTVVPLRAALVRTPETLDAPGETELDRCARRLGIEVLRGREKDAEIERLRAATSSPTPPEGLHPHKPAIYGGYGVTCSCGAVLGWPSGWATTDEAARRVCLLHEYGLPESAIFDLVRLAASPAPDPGAALISAASRYRAAEWDIRCHEDSIRDEAHNARVEEWRAADAAIAALLGESSPFVARGAGLRDKATVMAGWAADPSLKPVDRWLSLPVALAILNGTHPALAPSAEPPETE